jgi:hypothetical protein
MKHVDDDDDDDDDSTLQIYAIQVGLPLVQFSFVSSFITDGQSRGFPSNGVSGDYSQPMNVSVALVFKGQG